MTDQVTTEIKAPAQSPTNNRPAEEKINQVIEVKQCDQLNLSSIAQTVYGQQNVRPEIRTALEKFDFRPLERHEFGALAGMGSEEMKYLDLFWDPAFNKGWLYLSDDMVRSQLTNDTGINAVTHFNKRVLATSDYTPGVDYKQIEYDDQLIVLYLACRPPNLVDGIKPKKINNKAYYAVSGGTYLDLLARASTEGGKLARLTFRKVADAARMMFEYINAIHAIMAEKRTVETTLRLAAAEKRAVRLEEEKRGPKEYPDEWFYLATCEAMARSRAYKFGIVTKQDTPAKRLSTYDCGYTDYCALDYVLCIKTKCAKSVEDAFREIVRPYLKAPRKDVVLLTFARCEKIALDLLQSINSSISDLVQMETEFRTLGDEPAPAFVRGEDNLIKFAGMGSAPKPVALPCDKCGKTYVRATCRQAHMDKCEGKKEGKRQGKTTIKITVPADSIAGPAPIADISVTVHSESSIDEMD